MSLPVPPIPREQARIRRYRGDGVAIFRAAVRASMLEEQWQLLLASVDGETRAFLERPPAPEAWVDARIIQQVMAHLHWTDGMTFGGTPGSLAAELVVHRHAGRWSSPQVLIAHLPGIWCDRVDGGVVSTERTGETSARLHLWADATFRYYFEVWLPAWLRRALESIGTRGARVAYRKPTEGEPYYHRYDVSWE